MGQIVVSFRQLENVVALAIKRKSSMTLAEAIALTDGIVERAAKAKESYEIWAMNQDLEGEFLKLVNKVGEVACRRNDVVHGFWAKDPAGCTRWIRNGIENQIDIERLKSLRNDNHRLIADFNDITTPAVVTIDEILVSAMPLKTPSNPPKDYD